MINNNPKPNKVYNKVYMREIQNGGDGKGTAFFCFLAFIVIIVAFFMNYKQKNVIFIANNARTIDCKLLDKSYNGSTLKINPVSTVGMGMNGNLNVGVGSVISGTGERFITIFDCGNYGTIVSEDGNIFRLAKDGENKLKISFYGNRYRIFDLNN